MKYEPNSYSEWHSQGNECQRTIFFLILGDSCLTCAVLFGQLNAIYFNKYQTEKCERCSKVQANERMQNIYNFSRLFIVRY